MSELKMLKAEKPLQPENGDIIWLNDYIYDELTEEEYQSKQAIMFGFYAVTDLPALELLGMTQKHYDSVFDEETLYECPYYGTIFTGVIPIGIVSDDISKYNYILQEDKNQWEQWELKRLLDNENTKETCDEIEEGMNGIMKATLGHGFDECRLTSDGYGEIKPFKVKLNNGDDLIVMTWEWYNK